MSIFVPPFYSRVKYLPHLGNFKFLKRGERFYAFPIYSGNCQSHLGDCSNKKNKSTLRQQRIAPSLFHQCRPNTHTHTLHPLPSFPMRTRNIHFATPSSWSGGKRGGGDTIAFFPGKKTSANKFEIRCGKPIYVYACTRVIFLTFFSSVKSVLSNMP